GRTPKTLRHSSCVKRPAWPICSRKEEKAGLERIMEQDRRPIGYWLKHLDRPIEETFERPLSSTGLTRRHWQVLNTLNSGRTTNVELAVALRPFVVDD